MRVHWTGLIVLMLTGCGSRALIVERQTEVVLIPPKSKEAHFYYVYEGIGVTAAPKEKIEDRLKEAKKELDAMKKPSFPFLGFPVDLFYRRMTTICRRGIARSAPDGSSSIRSVIDNCAWNGM